MKVRKSVRTSSMDANGNWKTEEIDIELSPVDIGIKGEPEVGDHRKISAVLLFECEVFLCKAVKDPAFSEQLTKKAQELAAQKGEIDGLKKQIGLGKA